MKVWTVLKVLNVAFNESAMSRIQVHEWHKRFHDDCEDVEVNKHPHDPYLAIFSDVLGIPPNFIPKLLNFEQQLLQQEIARELLNEAKIYPELVKRVETKAQSSK